MSEKMTVKEIAAVCNVEPRTVQLWIKTLPRNDFEVVNGKAGKYTLRQVIEIIRAGGNETLAKLLLENAIRKEKQEAFQRAESKKLRNYFTDTLRDHGYKSPHEYIQTTKQMKKQLQIEGRKDDLDPNEVEMIAISERLATLRIRNLGLTGYHGIIWDCLKSCDTVMVACGKIEKRTLGR